MGHQHPSASSEFPHLEDEGPGEGHPPPFATDSGSSSSSSSSSGSSSSSSSSSVDDLVRWLASEQCTYGGIRDRLVIGHRVLRIVASSEAFEASQECVEQRMQRRTLQAERAADEARARLEDAQRSAASAADVAAAAVRAEREAAAEAVRAERAKAAEALRAERDGLAEALRAERERLGDDRARLADERARMGAHHAELLTRLSDVSDARARAEAREAEAHARLEARLANLQSADVQRLRAEVDRLRSTNHVKGAQGEAAVAAAVRGAFDSWSFVDTSARGGESDFHLVSPRGEVLVVEVKNKATVSAGDVSKSLRDAAELRERLGPAMLGYLFVSLRSRGIPGKGALMLEMAKAGAGTGAPLPLLWCGLEEGGGDEGVQGDAFAVSNASTANASAAASRLDEARARDVVRAARVLVDVGRALAVSAAAASARLAGTGSDGGGDEGVGRETEEALADAVAKLNDQLERLDGMRRIAARLNESATATRKHACALQAAIDQAFRELDSLACVGVRPQAPAPVVSITTPTATSLPTPTATPAPTATSGASHECGHCSKVCSSRQGLSNHARSCPRRPKAPLQAHQSS